jgi:hypothetical protein
MGTNPVKMVARRFKNLPFASRSGRFPASGSADGHTVPPTSTNGHPTGKSLHLAQKIFAANRRSQVPTFQVEPQPTLKSPNAQQLAKI